MSGVARAKKGSLSGWILFLATLIVLSFAAMPGFDAYSMFADRALIAIRLSLVLALSILVLRNTFSLDATAYQDSALLKRLRRWYYDEEPALSAVSGDEGKPSA